MTDDLDAAILASVLAKSRPRRGRSHPDTLTEHSADTRDAALAVATRIGSPGLLASWPRFWEWVTCAALLHDAGKVAEGFQHQLTHRDQPWGERHEVLSLAYADLLLTSWPAEDRAMVMAGIAFHHRCLEGGRPRRSLRELYPPDADWERKFGRDPEPAAGRPRVQVPLSRHTALLAWLAAEQGIDIPADASRKLWERARDMFAELEDRWGTPLPDDEGLLAVLLQGAVTLADRSASAGVQLGTAMPLPRDYISRLATPYPHQRAAAGTPGHMVLIAPTGSGKTEAGLAWAAAQMAAMPALPRLMWLLPYRASIDAAAARFADDFKVSRNDIGVVHGTAALTQLAWATHDDGGPAEPGEKPPGKDDAVKAKAQASAARLFRQRIRVATPYQLIPAAIAGPAYSSVLTEQANALMVLDELHAYEPRVFGRICALMALWEKLGSRVAVMSATLAPPMTELISDSLARPVTVHRAAAGTAAVRHRLAVDPEPLMSPPAIARIRDWLSGGFSVLAVVNTVRQAQDLFSALRGFAARHGGAVLLHSRFRHSDRDLIEATIRRRYPERRPGEPACRGGGLVVSTQALEVSLCLDFDRGVSELAPAEAIAQRAGRVNRRGLHPGGPAEFRVHAVESALPYDDGALTQAWLALQDSDGQLVSEETVSTWLERVYDSEWGQQWARLARQSRDSFADAFLRFAQPFHDRSEFRRHLERDFDSTEVLLARDLVSYRQEAARDPLLAARHLIPVRYSQRAQLAASGHAWLDDGLDMWVTDTEYDRTLGLIMPSRDEP